MESLGVKVKALRKKKKMTLSELSVITNLSTGYLSQFERGKTTIAIEYLQKIANAFDVPIEHLLKQEMVFDDPVVRSYNQETIRIFNNNVYKSLSKAPKGMDMMPKIVEVLPQMQRSDEPMENYSHIGEEFLYVLDGILTLHMEKETYHLYPGDAVHFASDTPHNWENETDRVVRFVAVHCPCDLDLDTLERLYHKD